MQPVTLVPDEITPDAKRLLAEWNATTARYRPTACVHELFREIASAHPDRVAIEWADRRLRYSELDRQSDELAARLVASGAGPESVIGLCMPRSAGAIVGILGILKAGAAYLPLDPAYPASRLAFMTENAQVKLVVASRDHIGLFDDRDLTTIVVDTEPTDSSLGISVNPPLAGGAGAGADRLAYIMYTSGSTGAPKGVQIEHRSIVRLVGKVDYVRLDESTCFMLAAPLGFDASTLEIWGPLLHGGRIVVLPEAVPTGRGVAKLIADYGVNTAWLTAALFNSIVDDDPEHLRGLRQLLVGGEALSPRHVRGALDALPNTELINGFGPTECTTFTTTYSIPHDLPASCKSIPIGRPITDTALYVLDDNRRLVPIGADGELYVGGLGLARGYLARPDLDAERFVRNPFVAGEKLYRTGDIVRWRDDGVVEFVGRADQQVKVRGFRIEPGEIEARLTELPDVRACAVTARSDRSGAKRLIAYVVPAAERLVVSDLRDALLRELPEFMVPAIFVAVDALPLTAAGKLDRLALPEPPTERPQLAHEFRAPIGIVETTICTVFAEVLGLDRAGSLDAFFELGGDSLSALRVLSRLRQAGLGDISVARFFAAPTPASLARDMQKDSGIAATATARPTSDARRSGIPGEPIAVIGMAGRFPGARDVEEFWSNLCAGRESIRFFKPEELDPSIPMHVRADPLYVAARGVIDDVEMFDAGFFGISPLEAQLMDPQQRHFLQIAWHALEHAGYVPESASGRVGIFGGMYNASYFQRHLLPRPDITQRMGELQTMLANEKDYLTSRVAHKLGLSGPAVTIQTACSTSLVAVASAMDSLRNGNCDMALAGGVAITCPPRSGYLYQEGAMASSDGHTRAFDAEASGTVFSDGAAMVVLRRLTDAQAAGDTIYAVLLGAAVNNDGGQRASFTAPSPEGQAAVIAEAHSNAGIDARTLSYIEAHGTATPLGDPIEIEGLTRAFRQHTADRGFCAIGSLKSNIGHLIIAAGAASLIKTSLALARRTIPPSIGFQRANPKIDFENSPFRVQSTLEPWAGAGPRRAGVSSFGFGGTNCHVVLEEAPTPSPTDHSTRTQLLVLSARNSTALSEACANLAKTLTDPAAPDLADIAYTLQIGRKAFAHRRYFVAHHSAEAVQLLACADVSRSDAREAGTELADFALIFPGQGSQYPRMARGLYANEPVFRTVYDECCKLIAAEMGLDVKTLFFSDDPQALLATSVTQPALFAIEYSLAKLWLSWGVRPTALLGHSVGEIVCAALAGVMQLEDAVGLIVERSRRMQAVSAGSMLAVRLSAAELQLRLPAALQIAAENAPNLCVASGPTSDIERLKHELDAENIIARTLVTSHAFHSAMMDEVVEPTAKRLESMRLAAPRIPILSTVTADWMTPALATSPRYWAEHLRRPVRFGPAVARLLEDRRRVLIEVGPRSVLSTLARQTVSGRRDLPVAIASLADSADAEANAVTTALGQAWACGAQIDWHTYWAGERRRRVPLPGYPFQGTRCWVDPPAPAAALIESPVTIAPTITTKSEVPAMPPIRRDRLIADLRQLVEEVTGLDVSNADSALPWLELGLDSLALTQLALQVQRKHPVKLTFRQIMEQFTSLASLADMLDSQLPKDALQARTIALPVEVPLPLPPIPAPGAEVSPYVRQVIEQQLQVMARQLQILGGAPGVPNVAPPADTPARADTSARADGARADDDTVTRYDVKKAFGAIARIHTTTDELTALQRTRLDALVARYNARTRRSKEYTARHRAHMADPRVVNGFRPLTKELTYQLVVERSRGSRVWDIDGNDYIDVLSGFGMSLFGWQPDFIREALHEQIERGYEIGPQHVLAGEVAELFCQLTGTERAAFCNTGSEAVMGAMRIARTVTGRSTIAIFAGAYHGIFDEVIVRGTKKLKSIPAAPGIMPAAVQNVLVLDYATPESMAILRERAHDLAAILVEPVPSRRPDLQPVEFLRELRRLTEGSGSLLIFDEVVTGFRAHPRGIQGLYGIQADLASYGKVVGGGFPIGVIAGKRQYMDALDGGHWEYGDASIPTVGVTYFAGTFVRHPLALAAAKAALQRLIAAGPELQERLSARTAAMVAEINAFMNEIGAPLRLNSFASLWRNVLTDELPYGDLIYVMLRDRGIHILDNFPCFLTTAHSDSDIAAIVAAYKDAARQMQASGFFPARPNLQLAAPAGIRVVQATEAQREVWLADRLGNEASLAYNESVSITLRGKLEVSALQRALQELPRRHDALRSTFTADGLNVRVAEQAFGLDVPVHDLSGVDTAAGEAQLEAIRERHVTQPFDLERGPLIRADLVRMAADRHVLVFTGHHIVLDGWSFWVVVKDLGALYAQATGENVGSIAVAPSFADYASECASRLESAEVLDNERWWADQFADSVPTLDLPTDRARLCVRSTRAGREDRLLPAELVGQLKKLGTRQGASLFATLLAGFNTLLHRLTAQEDVVVGIPAAGQNAAGLGGLVGHCVNMLPLRALPKPTMTFSELLKATRAAMLDAYEHQNVTFGRLLQITPVARDPARLPLISVMFNIDQALSAQSGALRGLELSLESNPRRFENFELFVNAADLGAAGMRLECQFNSDLFDRETVSRWLAAYETLLRSAVASADQTLNRMVLMPAGERRLLESWNDTRADYPVAARIEDLITVAAAQHSARTAVRAGERVLQYPELIERAYGLAASIRDAGVAGGEHVGLLLDRDEHLLPSLVGALCAGVAYVPLEPALPVERLNFMIQDSDIRVIVTTRAVAERLPTVVNSVRTLFAEQSTPTRTCPRAGSPDDVAYVIYTSGSTGKPKGVCVPHRAVVNFLTSMARRPGMSERDRLAAITTLSFDIAGLELLLPLTVGAEVILVPREVAMDGSALRGFLDRSSITVMQATPATWRLLVTAGWPGGREFRALCGGEALDCDLAASLHARVGELWNLYGPTETTIWSTAGRVERVDRPITIGTPIANTTVHILSADLERQPVGVVGEICIGGAGVATGYLNRRELTAERFFVHPTLGRLYRTGDLGRWVQADGHGALECRGRADFQVKLRGYRIELGEIEAALAQHPAVAQAVVVANHAGADDMRLIAYVVCRGQCPPEAELRAFLSRTLPDYMVPQRFATVPVLPLTANGKIDRKALPAVSPQSQPVPSAARPATPLEDQLANAFRETLCVPRVGLDEDFFASGGHSLIASQMAALLSQQLGITLPLRAIFQHPTVAKLAAWIEAQRRTVGRDHVAVQRRKESGPAPLSLMQQRVWYLEQLQPGRTIFNVPTAHRLRGKLDIGMLNAAYTAMVRRQSALRTVINVVGGEPSQVVLDEVDTAIPFVDLSMLAAEAREPEVMRRLGIDVNETMDLSTPMLIRTRLYKLSDVEHVLLFMPHHAIFDGWSFDLFYEEMSELYAAIEGEREPRLPQLTIDYADFSVWLNDWLAGKELERQLNYWRNKLRGAPESLDIPVDRPRPAKQTGLGDTAWMRIPPTTVAALRKLSLELGATFNMALLSVWTLVLHQLTAQDEILMGMPVRGRNMPEFEKLMGFFVNALPLRLRVDSNQTFGQFLQAVRTECIEAFGYPDVPFEHLVRVLDLPRDESRFPLYQAFFSYQDARQRPSDWGSLRHQNVPVFQPSSAQDIGLWFLDGGNGVVGGINYNTDILDRATADRIHGRYLGLLEAIIADPHRTVRSLIQVNDNELQQIRQWNQTAMALPDAANLAQYLAAALVAGGDQIAVRSAGEAVSYVALAAQSARIAASLRSRGVAAGDVVGLMLERGPQVLAAMLGALEAGATYLPLDPAFPAGRIEYMLRDSGARLLIANVDTSHLALDAVGVLPLDQALRELPIGSANDQPISVGPDAAAYLIYTSGSTGKPKGVSVPHGAVINFLESMRRQPGLKPGTRFAAVTTFSFDIALLELLLPLCVGGELVIVGREEAADGVALRRILEEQRIDAMQATPATWRLLIEAGWRGSARFKALCGGEALPIEVAEALLERCGELWNLYGPTETTVWSTAARIESGQGEICIGKPIGNTQVWVLDSAGEVAPVGVPGEIYIGGWGVALGYLNQPELTAERFVPDKFSNQPGARLYRTGDVGRWCNDGRLQHLGRSDLQVKIRGHRIEPGEIEGVLSRHPEIEQAVVVAHGEAGMGSQLVAYWTGRGKRELPPAELRELLRADLPDYMLPTLFIRLDKVPLTVNGKVDRRALPTPAAIEASRQLSTANAARSESEKRIADVWCTLLGITRVNIADNFLDIGGHSLLVMRAVAMLETQTGVRLSPRAFIFQTLEAIAAELDRGLAELSGGPRPQDQGPKGKSPKARLLQRLVSALTTRNR